MPQPAHKFLLLIILAGATCFTACGDQSDEAQGPAAGSVKTDSFPDAPDAAMQYVLGGLADANGAVLWEAMPQSYRADVNAIAQLAGSKIDPDIYDKVFATISRIATVFDKQKEFIYSSVLVDGKYDQAQVAQMRAAWPSVMNIVQALTNSSLSSAAKLQDFKGETFFANTMSTMLAQMDALSKLQPDNEGQSLADFKKVEIEYLEGTDTEAILKMSIPGQVAGTENFIKVEGRWVPQEMADTWASQIVETRTKLEAIDPNQMLKQKPQILSVFVMVDGVLTQIEAAETQEQFDQALQSAMMPIMGLLMMGQSMKGGMMNSAPQTRPAMPVAP